MTLTKQSAWSIFKGTALGQPEAKQAIDSMHHGEFEAYDCWREDFEMAIAQIGVEAQNEAATIQEDNPELMVELQATPMNRWKAEEYTKAVSMFKGSKFEQLHLSAMFRVANNELLLDLAKDVALA
jgi:hypothetical protein